MMIHKKHLIGCQYNLTEKLSRETKQGKERKKTRAIYMKRVAAQRHPLAALPQKALFLKRLYVIGPL